MNEALMIYVYITLGNVVELLKVAVTFLVIYITAYALTVAAVQECSPWSKIPGLKTSLSILLLSSALIVAYPSKEDLKYIIGGAALLNIAQTDEAQQLPKNILDTTNNFLEFLNGEMKGE